MNYNKLIQGILAGTVAVSSILPIAAEAKPTLGERIDRTISTVNKKRKEGVQNFKDWRQDRKLWEAKKCEKTGSNSLRCKKLIQEARNKK
jgi:hypothetical protein